MSVRKKTIIALLLGAINMFGLVGWFSLFAPKYVWFAVLPAIAAGLYTISLRCPKCGRPVFKKDMEFAGEHFTYWGGFPPKRCASCGFNLTGKRRR